MNVSPNSIATMKDAVRTMLAGVEPEPQTRPATTAIGWAYAHAVLGRTAEAQRVLDNWTAALADDPRPNRVCDSAGQTRPIYAFFAAACRTKTQRLLGLSVERSNAPAGDAPGPAAALWRAHELLASGAPWSRVESDVERLWHAALARQRLTPADGSVGNLHPLDAETCLDAFVFDELCALHAGFLAALAAPEPAGPTYPLGSRLQRMRRVALYHVANTQPDNTTNQPWGLAAFAYWPETRDFAVQQLHDTRTWLAAHPGPAPGLIAGLLADVLAFG